MIPLLDKLAIWWVKKRILLPQYQQAFIDADNFRMFKNSAFLRCSVSEYILKNYTPMKNINDFIEEIKKKFPVLTDVYVIRPESGNSKIVFCLEKNITQTVDLGFVVED